MLSQLAYSFRSSNDKQFYLKCYDIFVAWNVRLNVILRRDFATASAYLARLECGVTSFVTINANNFISFTNVEVYRL